MLISKAFGGLVTLGIALAAAQDSESIPYGGHESNVTTGPETGHFAPSGDGVSIDPRSSFLFVKYGTPYGWNSDAFETAGCYYRIGGKTILNDWLQYGGRAGCGTAECDIWAGNRDCSGTPTRHVTGTTHLDGPGISFWSWKCWYTLP